MFSKNICDYSIREKLPDTVKEIEMSLFESAFLCGLIKQYKPENILEVGVSAGGTTSLMLTALKEYGLKTNLYSVDILPSWYRDKKLRTGWTAYDNFPKAPNWALYTGLYLPQILPKLNLKFDMCVIDTLHVLPGEALDFLVAIKFMNMGGIVCFHDIALYFYYKQFYESFATKVVYDACVGDKILCEETDYDFGIPNIGAFVVTEDTYKYIDNPFSTLSMRWSYLPSQEEKDIYAKFYEHHYGKEYAHFFELAYKQNRIQILYNAEKKMAATQREQ